MQINLSRLKILDDHLKNDKTAEYGGNILEMLAFRNWCGMGTRIYENIKNDLDDPNRMYKIDVACRNHDIAYTKAKTEDDLKQADNVMMWEIFEKYIANFKNNFITGDYKDDFSTWTGSFGTVYNYMMSLLETVVLGDTIYKTGKLILSGISAPFKMGHDLYKTVKMPPIEPETYNTVVRFANLLRTAGAKNIPNRIPTSNYEYMKNRMMERTGTVGKAGMTLALSSIVKDKIFAIISLSFIGLKKGFEYLTGYNIVPLTKHDVSEEDIQNLIKVFELLQNEYLLESGLPQIKITDEWMNEVLTEESKEKLEKEITQISLMNKEHLRIRYEQVKDEPMSEVSEHTKEISNMFVSELVNNTTAVMDIADKFDTKNYVTEAEDNPEFDQYIKKWEELDNYIEKIFNEKNYDFETEQVTEPIQEEITEPIQEEITEPIQEEITEPIQENKNKTEL
jgi:hypothetical protein